MVAVWKSSDHMCRQVSSNFTHCIYEAIHDESAGLCFSCYNAQCVLCPSLENTYWKYIVLHIPVKALLMLVHYRKILHVGVVSRDSAFAFYISLSTVPLCNISRIALYPGTKKNSIAQEQGYFPLCMNISSTLTNICIRPL